MQTILSRTIDRYIKVRREGASKTKIDPILELLVEQMIEKCMQAGDLQAVVGISIEANRWDVLEKVLSPGQQSLVCYAADLAMQQQDKQSQVRVLQLCVDALLGPHSDADTTDWIFIADCLMVMGKTATGALKDRLPSKASPKYAPIHAQLLYNEASSSLLPYAPYDRIVMHMLMQSCASDVAILTKTRGSISATNSMLHTGLSLSNAFMHAGTSRDDWLRANLDWLSHASLWTKFTGVASMGLIHRGQHDRKLLEAYLPPKGSPLAPTSTARAGPCSPPP